MGIDWLDFTIDLQISKPKYLSCFPIDAQNPASCREFEASFCLILRKSQGHYFQLFPLFMDFFIGDYIPLISFYVFHITKKCPSQEIPKFASKQKDKSQFSESFNLVFPVNGSRDLKRDFLYSHSYTRKSAIACLYCHVHV